MLTFFRVESQYSANKTALCSQQQTAIVLKYLIVTSDCLITANIDDNRCACSSSSGELLDIDPNSSDAGSVFSTQDVLYSYITQYQETWGYQ